MSLFMARNGLNDGKAMIFAPEKRFEIGFFAELIVQVMQAAHTGARVWFPGDVMAEFDEDCSEAEIISGYQEYINASFPTASAANENRMTVVPKE